MNLEKGQVIKNYKELCKLLGVKPTKGKGRNYHIAEFERYCTYTKQGHKFIIEEVFAEPKPKVDGRVNNGGNIANTKYEDLMDRLIINLLINYDYIEESFSSLMNNYFDFFTKEYDKLFKVGYKRYAEINGLGKGVTMTYQQKVSSIVEGCLETSLNRLHRQKIINYDKKILIRGNDFETDFADPEMEYLIADTESKVYKELDMTPFARSNPRKNRQFKNKVSEYLDIMSYYNVYCFELVDKATDYVEEDRDELVRRFINSAVDAVQNKTSVDDFGNRFKPYSYQSYQSQIDKLTILLWRLPEGYATETDAKEEMKNLFGNVEPTETATTDKDDKCEDMQDMYNLDCDIPF